MTSDLRAVLEGIVYGDDPKITPGDRLRAAEQLRDLQERAWPTVRQLIDAMPPEEVAAAWDEQCGAWMVHEALAGRSPYPRFMAAFTAAVTERAAALAHELADADRIEAEIERRAQERAVVLYRTRAFTAVAAPEAPTAAQEPEAAADVPDAPNDAPLGLTAADVQRLWHGNRKRRDSPFRP